MIVEDIHAEALEVRGLGSEEATGEEGCTRFDAEVIAAAQGRFLAGQAAGEAGLVGRALLVESLVVVDALQALLAGCGLDAVVVFHALDQRIREGTHVVQCYLIALLVREEPVAVVVLFEVGEEDESGGGDRDCFHIGIKLSAPRSSDH